MRSEFEPKRIREAKETLGRQLERVEQMQRMQKEQQKQKRKAADSLFSRLSALMGRLF